MGGSCLNGEHNQIFQQKLEIFVPFKNRQYGYVEGSLVMYLMVLAFCC